MNSSTFFSTFFSFFFYTRLSFYLTFFDPPIISSFEILPCTQLLTSSFLGVLVFHLPLVLPFSIYLFSGPQSFLTILVRDFFSLFSPRPSFNTYVRICSILFLSRGHLCFLVFFFDCNQAGSLRPTPRLWAPPLLPETPIFRVVPF